MERQFMVGLLLGTLRMKNCASAEIVIVHDTFQVQFYFTTVFVGYRFFPVIRFEDRCTPGMISGGHFTTI